MAVRLLAVLNDIEMGSYFNTVPWSWMAIAIYSRGFLGNWPPGNRVSIKVLNAIP
jgi:hypothetical protein